MPPGLDLCGFGEGVGDGVAWGGLAGIQGTRGVVLTKRVGTVRRHGGVECWYSYFCEHGGFRSRY